MPPKRKITEGDAARSKKKKLNTSSSSAYAHSPRKSRKYVYDPLTSNSSIRILELQPGKKSEAIKCQLSVVEREQAPPYEAISYAWGNPANTKLIKCGGGTLKITTSLWNALRQFREAVHARFLWADAVCIDQGNDEERGHQVKQMGWIYANAVRVLAWLGLDDESDFGNWLGGSFSAWIDQINFDLGQKWDAKGPTGMSRLSPEDLDDDAVYRWSQFSKLLKRPWFKRLWVVQEIGMARSVQAFIGDVEFDFIDLLRLTTKVQWSGPLVNHFNLKTDQASTFSIFPARLQEIGRHDYDFLDILDLARVQQASDPRDYVYALLGHPSATIGGVPIIEPDYSKSASEVFSDVAIKLIKQTNSLRILSAIIHRDESDLQGELPSWIPAWRRDVQINFLAIDQFDAFLYDASCGLSPPSILVGSDRTLHIRGFIFDAIDEYTETMKYTGRTQYIEENWVHRQPIQIAMRFKSQRARSAGNVLSDIGLTLTACCRLGDGLSKKTLSRHNADFAAFRLHLINLASQGCDVETNELAPEGIRALQETGEAGEVGKFLYDIDSVCTERKLFSTRKGLLGLGPGALREGNLCCILFDARVPFILRQVGSRYRLIGEAYIHGATKGEAVVDFILSEKYQEQVFEIF